MHDFDHDLVFKLEGRHSDLSCESCHLNQVFLGTPDECSECHQEPEIHAGYFGLLCENCHSTVAWSPAQLTAHSFPLDHGEQTLLACDVCHVEKYTEYTCYECHEHQPAEVIEEHLDEGISMVEIEHCVDCHPTGLDDETD
jgi:hypothetical protein